MANYVVAAIKEWNVDAFNKYSVGLQGDWHFVDSPEELSIEFLKE
jgi:hypothetical protein